ncbi:MAG: hypothetical protein U0167_13960 [bacterium]
MRLPMIAVVALLSLNACASKMAVVAKDDPARTPAPAPHAVAPPQARPAVQGPVAVLGIPPGHYPPLGACRVWMPGTPPGQQQAPCSCFSLMLDVPLGAMVLYRPTSDESVLQVSKYDASRPNTIVAVDVYDLKSGKLLRSALH